MQAPYTGKISLHWIVSFFNKYNNNEYTETVTSTPANLNLT